MSYCNPHTQSEELFLALFLSFWNLRIYTWSPLIQVLAVGEKIYEKRPTINIQNFELMCEDSVKLLGMVGNQKPLKGPSELMLYNNFCLGLHANLL
jgi:hypothetical protein